MTSLVLCLGMFLGKPGEVFYGTVLTPIVMILIGFLLVAMLAALGVMIYHEHKADSLTNTLENEYVSGGSWKYLTPYN